MPQVRRRMLAAARTVLAAAGLVAWAATAQAPQDLRIALVIGNSGYPAPATLLNPANDAAAVGKALRTLGFEVVELRDGSRAQMHEALARVGQALKGKQAIAMLYYAGHGVQVDFRNYMVPVDARLATVQDVPAQAVDVSQVIAAFRGAGTRMNILVLDACRDNPFGEGSGKGLAPLDAPTGTFLAYATAPGNVAEDGDASSGNGLYTGYLVKELQKPAARIEDVFKRVRMQVRQHSKGRQIPWESTSLEEDFYFNDGAKHTFRAEDFEKLQQAALERRELELAAAQAAESERLKKLSVAKAREEAFSAEKAAWDRIKDSRNVDDIYAFVAQYPNGSLAEHANERIEMLQAALIRPQADVGGKQQVPFLERYRQGDRMEFVQKDGLTGIENGRGVIEVRYRDEQLLDGVVVSGNILGMSATRAGFVARDGSGSYDPPWAAVPGGDYQVGKRVRGRSLRTDAQGHRIWVDYETHIVAREKLQTAFGELDTYRVEVTRQLDPSLSQKLTFWFDPDWGYSVKLVTETRRLGASGPPTILVREMVRRERKA